MRYAVVAICCGFGCGFRAGLVHFLVDCWNGVALVWGFVRFGVCR